jgi:hypothetical protein
MLRRLLDGDLYPHNLKVRHHAGYPNTDGAVIVLPGRYYAAHTDQINEAIQRYEWLLLVRVSDEEDEFDCSNLLHDNMKVWLQTPRQGRDYGDARLFGVGFPPHFNELGADVPKKSVDLYLEAQNTHCRRNECFEALKNLSYCVHLVRETEGFTQGAAPDEYAAAMRASKIAPCPSGAVSCDSFRFWEALEAHCIPIADTVSPVDGPTDYWGRVLPGYPFPTITDYGDLAGYVEDMLAGWPANSNRIAAWWMRLKRQYALDLVDDLRGLGAI